jgi:hypothetical protein
LHPFITKEICRFRCTNPRGWNRKRQQFFRITDGPTRYFPVGT